MAVVERFALTLERLEHISLTGFCQGTEPADIECLGPDGRVVGIQIGEMVDNDLRCLTAMRATYSEYIRSTYPDVLARFNGHWVTLLDQGDPPYLPSIGTPSGRACREELARWLSTVADELSVVVPQRRLIRNHPIGPSARNIMVTVEPLAASV